MSIEVRVEDLTFRYPGAPDPVLEGITFSSTKAEFILVAGPSGAGKSTLLRCLNGLVPHFSGGVISGTVTVDGIDVLAVGPQKMSRHVGFVFQNPEAQMVLDTVEAEIAFGLENLAVPQREIVNRVEEVLTLLDLMEFRERPVSDLSGGERQRVAIATALVLRPHLLVLDEPTSQLDPDAAREILTHIVNIQKNLGLTVILVEQRLDRVARFANRLIYLEDGRLTADGPIRETVELLPPEQRPPITRLAMALDWQPLPLTSAEGRQLAPYLINKLPEEQLVRPETNGQGSHRKPILEARSIHFAYGKQEILRGVNLSLCAGEATALIGANGSGKSTLLKCLVGLLRPNQGDIHLDRHSIAGQSVAEICRQVAYLPQTPDDLLFSETVREELQATLLNHEMNPLGGVVSPDELLDELGLRKFADAYPRDLSVGQRQRVALGAVMITRPRLLLLDEPTRGLDYAAKQRLAQLWASWRRQGMGILIVTHDMELAARVADRVLIIKDGKIDVTGAADEILGSSSLYGPQMARLFPESGLLTVHDALEEFEDKR